jgi:hypothetical protein
MDMSEMKAARLDRAREKQVEELQRELGCRIVAFDPPSELAHLSPDQCRRLEGVEKELGVSLVAYEATARLRLANPPEARVRELRELEKKLGYVLVAYEPVRPVPKSLEPMIQQIGPSAQLSDAQYARLQQVEDEVGVVLLAFKGR